MKRRIKPIVDTGRRLSPTPERTPCSRYVLRERAPDGSEWTSDPVGGDARHAAANVVAGMPGVSAGGFRWAETLDGKLVAGARPSSS